MAVAGDTHPIRVVRIITRLNIGGPAIQAIRLSERLTAHGFETLLVHGRLGAGEGDMQYMIQPGASHQYLARLQRAIAPIDDVLALGAIYRVMLRVRPAIVHTHMAKAGMLGRAAAALYNRTAGRRTPARVVHTYHGHVLEGYFARRSSAAVIRAERALARVTDAIVAISPRIRRDLVEQYGIGRESQYRVIPLGFDLEPFAAVDDDARAAARRVLDIAPAVPVVTTVGRLTAIKQQHLFLEVARHVATRHHDAVFLLAGDGDLRDGLQATAQTLGIAHQVRFLGWRRDLPTIYAASDVFLLTSGSEGTPVALIETMAAATPGVSTDVGGVRDVITGPDLGIVVPAGDVDALARATLALVGDAERRRDTGRRARAAVLGRYGLDRLVHDVERLYRDLLHAGSA
jgi:glycosyltransferase involved in cell wall biosynthesis